MTKSNKYLCWDIEKQVTALRVVEIEALADKGYQVKKVTPYQYRINNRIDLFPTGGKYHDIKTGERGLYPAWRNFKDIMDLQRQYNNLTKPHEKN